MNKKEKLFIFGTLAAALLLCGFFYFLPRSRGASVQITIDGQEFGTYSLSEDQTISIGKTNACEICDGEIRMISATCPDQLCIKQTPIGSDGGIIVCLPNKIVIEGSVPAY